MQNADNSPVGYVESEIHFRASNDAVFAVSAFMDETRERADLLIGSSYANPLARNFGSLLIELDGKKYRLMFVMEAMREALYDAVKARNAQRYAAALADLVDKDPAAGADETQPPGARFIKPGLLRILVYGLPRFYFWRRNAPHKKQK